VKSKRERARDIRAATAADVDVFMGAVHLLVAGQQLEQLQLIATLVMALKPLEFDERRRLVRWVCDYYGLDPAKLEQHRGPQS
jgi:hypothetical protein